MFDAQRVKEFLDSWEREPNRIEELTKFRNRVIGVARIVWDDYFREYVGRQKRLAIVSGTLYTGYGGYVHSGFYKALCQTKTLFEVVSLIQALLWMTETEVPAGFNDCCRQLQDALALSPSVMIRLVQHNNTATLYPAGVRMLDEGTVEGNIAWLRKYPNAAKPFDDALKVYLANDPKQYRHMLDSLRCSVEQVLRAVLNNQKSLENQKEEFLRWLGARDAHSQIVGMYNDLLFNRYAKYQNDAVKHQEDKYTPAEVEFVLYLTGTLLRFIQYLSEQDA